MTAASDSEPFESQACTPMSISTIHRGLAQHTTHLPLRPTKRVRLASIASLQQTHEKNNFGSAFQSRYRSTTPGTSHTSSEPRAATSWLFRGSRVRVSTLFTALLAFGVGATTLGLYVVCPSHIPALIFESELPDAALLPRPKWPLPQLRNIHLLHALAGRAPEGFACWDPRQEPRGPSAQRALPCSVRTRCALVSDACVSNVRGGIGVRFTLAYVHVPHGTQCLPNGADAPALGAWT